MLTPNKQRLISTFLQLVKIPSPSGHEDEIRKFLKVKLQKLGFVARVDKEGNLYGLNRKTSGPILLAAHMDTVEPAKVKKIVISNDFIKSDGSSVLGADDKAGIAAILETLEQFKENDVVSCYPKVLFTTREETTGGVKGFRTDWVKIRYGLIADNDKSLGTWVKSSPYIYDLEITVKGRAAHSGSPEKGINALQMSVEILTLFPMGKRSESSFNIGVISGGNNSNIVPNLVNLKGEFRSFNKLGYQKQLVAIEKIADSIEKKFGGAIIIKPSYYCSGYSYKDTDPAVVKVTQAIKAAGIKPKCMSSWGASDANYLYEKGIHMVDISHGARNVHTTREKININNLCKVTEIFINYCLLDK